MFAADAVADVLLQCVELPDGLCVEWAAFDAGAFASHVNLLLSGKESRRTPSLMRVSER